jgi:hypothetical protein
MRDSWNEIQANKKTPQVRGWGNGDQSDARQSASAQVLVCIPWIRKSK